MTSRGALWAAFLVVAAALLAWMASAAVNGAVSAPTNGSAIAGNTTIAITFDGTANVTVEYNVTPGSFISLNTSTAVASPHNVIWQTMSVLDGKYGLRINITNSTDAGDSVLFLIGNLTVDNTLPTITSASFDDYTPTYANTSITLTASVTDTNHVMAVWLSNGSTNMSLSNSSPIPYSGSWTLALNLSYLGCTANMRCPIVLYANDTAGNTQNTSPLLYSDQDNVSILVNATNTTSARPGENITFGALWSDTSLHDPDGFTVVFQVDAGLGWRSSHPNLAAWNTSQLSLNWTNTTYRANGSDEGKGLRFRINLTDVNGRSNVTQNLTVVVANVSPVITLLEPVNDSVVSNTTPIQLNFSDLGIGLDMSTMNVTATSGGTSTTVSYYGNSSFFTCSSAVRDDAREWRLCNVSLGWTSGTVNLTILVQDANTNLGTTSLTYNVVSAPDVINISVNDVILASTTPGSSVSGTVNGTSDEVTINWSVDVTTPLNITFLSLANVTDRMTRNSTSLPAAVRYNLTAGKHYLSFNASVNNSPLTDTVQLNLTLNLPFNVTSTLGQYEAGMTSDIYAWIDGARDTGSAQYVNSTLDIIVNASNETDIEPFTVVLNYTGRTGTSLRWNATSSAFAIVTGDASDRAELDARTRGNASVVVESGGQTEVFFDNAEYLVTATFNLTNRTAYYEARTTTGTLYRLEECGTIPSAPIDADESCYTNTSTHTTLHLPRFDRADRIILVESPYAPPNLTIHTPTTVNDSSIPINFTVVTPLLNTTACFINLSWFNASSNTTILQLNRTLLAENLTLVGHEYRYDVSEGFYDDGPYNLTVICAGADGSTNTTVKSFTITDTTAPTISDVSVGDITRVSAVVSGTSSEPAIFSVLYGTSSSLGSTTESDSGYVESDSITLTLNAETTYHYNLSACDEAGNCGTAAGGTFTTTQAARGGGGGGGGAGGVPAVTAEAVDARVWGYVAPGDVVEYEPKKMAITNVRMVFTEAVDKVSLTISQFATRPPSVKEAPGKVYKYFSFQHEGITGMTSDRTVTFVVPDAWLLDVDRTTLRMYRLETDWVPYTPAVTDNAGDITTYEVDLPGFSYFAIAATSTAPDAPIDQVLDEVISEDAPIEDDPSVPAEEQPSGEFVSALDRTEHDTGVPLWLKIIFGVILLGLAGVGGLQGYKYAQRKEKEHEQQLVKERQVYVTKKQPVAHGALAPLQEYITRMRVKGVPEDDLRKRLIEAGWDEIVVDEELGRL